MSEYGIQDFETLSRWTLREVDIALKKIGVRRHNTYAARAALHGYKVPMRKVVAPPTESETAASKIDDQKAADVLKAALMRKQKESIGG
jgi:hypothetical protein